MLTALRSAARQRDIAQHRVSEQFGRDVARRSTASFGGTTVGPISPVSYMSSSSAPAVKKPEKEIDTKRHSVDTVSRMLDEMIEDRVDHRPARVSMPPKEELKKKRSSSIGHRRGTVGRQDRISAPPSSTAIPISSILRRPPTRKSMGPADVE
ncbi:hypothetical protein KEM55_000022, partial [Ascosphaera atra]